MGAGNQMVFEKLDENALVCGREGVHGRRWCRWWTGGEEVSETRVQAGEGEGDDIKHTQKQECKQLCS